jgi:hypothetical protein
MNKKCSTCKIVKTLDNFTKKTSSPDGLQYRCKSCFSLSSGAHYIERNKDPEFRKKQSKKTASIHKKNPNHYKNLHLLRSYGISLDEFKDMLIKQHNKCGICRDELIKPVVDHCHETGKVRKLLCYKCNILLGQARDNVNILANAISYLKEYQNETN